MRNTTLAVGLLLAVGSLAAEPWRPLFNGKDLDGWSRWLGPEVGSVEPLGRDSDPRHVFTVLQADDGPVIRASGEIFGTLTTVASFADYHLRLQFKWGEKKWPPRIQAPRDAGVLYHGQGPLGALNGRWQKSIEMQIQERDCGDLYPLGMRISATARRRDEVTLPPIYDETAPLLLFCRQEFAPGDQRPPFILYGRCARSENCERPHRQWNTVEVIVVGTSSIHVVNGQVVMRLSNAQRLAGSNWVPLTAGQISLQSEGAEIFYRGIELRETKEFPLYLAPEKERRNLP